MLRASGELTNKSPFGAYTIIRGACSAAYDAIVNPGGAVGSAPSGRGTLTLRFAVAGVGGGRVSARGCGTDVVNCAAAPADIAATANATRTAIGFIDRLPTLQSLSRRGTATRIRHDSAEDRFWQHRVHALSPIHH